MAPRSPLLLDGRALLDADRLLRAGVADRRARFELAFDRPPPHTGFLVVAGVDALLEMLSAPLVHEADLDGAARAGMLSEDLVKRVATLRVQVDVDAMPEGTIAFPRTPVAIVEGPFLQCVLLGTIARTILQRATAVATRTSRLQLAAGGDAIIDGSSALSSYTDASFLVARAAHVGGASATTNAAAAAALGIPYRASARLELGALWTAPAPSAEGWGDAGDDVVELGAGDDEEALLLEAKRLGARAAWIARGLADAEARSFPVRYELVALESEGAWSPRRGPSGDGDTVPGRKLAVRYLDAAGNAVADVVHLEGERMHSPRSVGAATLAPLARAVLRGGRAMIPVEPASIARERSVQARGRLPEPVKHLRAPGAYSVRMSSGLLDLADKA